MAFSNHAASYIKGVQLILISIVVGLYRHGDEGFFLGATYNYNVDTESLARGIFIGYLIYISCSLLASIVNSQTTLIDLIMNSVGFILWIVCGGLMLQYWLVFSSANAFVMVNPRPAGLAMSALAIVTSVSFLGMVTISYADLKSMMY